MQQTPVTEKLFINGKDVWVLVEPHYIQRGYPDSATRELFTVSYHVEDPAAAHGGVLFLEADKSPKLFESPVQAIEYASEKLGSMLPGS